MKKFIEVIEKSTLFTGINVGDIEAMMGCLKARTEDYSKNQTVLRVGDSVEYLAYCSPAMRISYKKISGVTATS